MMRIKKVIIKNFRSFNEEGIELIFPDVKFPFSIVGHNNSGKSNFINAILLGLGAKTSTPNSFDFGDFYLKNTNGTAYIEIHLEPALKSSNAFNTITEMPMLLLKITEEDGVIDVSHYCCGQDGKPVFNARSVKTGKKVYSDEEKEILSRARKDGAENVYKWKSKIPIFFIDPINFANQFKINRNTLLGKILLEIKKEFESKKTLVTEKKGVVQSHIGRPRIDVFESALDYLEKYIINTPNLEGFIAKVEEIIKTQLEIENDDFKFNFGLPNVDSFYNNLEFYITDNPQKPKLPITRMGNGFVSLFIVAFFRAIAETDKGGNIFILEEPETFLHEHFQEYFYNVLIKLSENNQVIFSTHSKKFVNLFETDSILRFFSHDFLKSEAVHNFPQKIEIPKEIDGFAIKNPKDFGKYMKSLEPNLGNLIFASRVIIVEGPHDLLGYSLSLSQAINFGLKNIAIICAWAKDSIITLVQLCKKFKVPFFVIHDWDLDNYNIDVSLSQEDPNSIYTSLSASEKQQYTKNRKILLEAGEVNLHTNKRKLETVLKIDNKNTASVFEKINGKTIEQIREEFPSFLPDTLLNFLKIDLKQSA